MSIDLENDELLTLAEACRLLPKKPAPSTLWRWRARGVVAGGRRIRLPCIRAGGTWLTTRRAFAEFLERLTEAALPAENLEDNAPSERPETTTRRLERAGLIGGGEAGRMAPK